jgi:hypothetical protein
VYDLKLIVGLVASLLVFVGYAPYVRDVLKGKTKPHVYTWFIWGFVTLLVFFFQYNAGGGAGSYLTLSAGLVCLLIFGLSFRHGTKDIKKSDKIFLILALFALGLYAITDQPLLSVVLLVAVDMLGFIPTIRKSWNKPHTETLFSYSLNTFRFAIGIYALQTYTVVTWLYPVAWLLANGLFSILLIVRRRQTSSPRRS